MPNEKIGRKLYLKDQAYGDLDEIIKSYIQPVNLSVQTIMQHQKFMDDIASNIEQTIKHEKEENPKLIPYRFGFSFEAPQFLVLYYAPKDLNVTTEYIKVKPNGLSFHDQNFGNLATLISWFKSNYTKPEYHKYLKTTKPPVSIPKPLAAKNEKSSHSDSHSKPSKFNITSLDYHSERVKYEKDFKVKDEKGSRYDGKKSHHNCNIFRK
jgi:transcription elongation factor SPT6